MENNINFGEQPFVGWCQICGLPLLADGSCKKYHIKKALKRGRFSGKSNSPNKFNDYK
jgi:hypothetical protein